MAAKPQTLSIGVLNGPNLNLLGRREPDLYGTATLAQISARLQEVALELSASIEFFQSNGEGELIDAVHRMSEHAHGFLINAGGYTHTSVALLDALLGVDLPFVEVHLTNTHAREEFRRTSLLAPRALGTIGGFGAHSYELGLRALVFHLRRGD
ncbi:MAG TPA: type II 3-dehydroquinate dehydratase [Longimicrobiales bacterium]